MLLRYASRADWISVVVVCALVAPCRRKALAALARACRAFSVEAVRDGAARTINAKVAFAHLTGATRSTKIPLCFTLRAILARRVARSGKVRRRNTGRAVGCNVVASVACATLTALEVPPITSLNFPLEHGWQVVERKQAFARLRSRRKCLQ